MMSKVSIGNGGVVVDGLGFLEQAARARSTRFLVRLRGSSRPLSMEYMRWMVQMQTRAVVSSWLLLQVLDDVFLAELEVVVGRDVLVELLLGLAAEVAAVHQEQHAPRAGELDQAVDEADGGEGLAAAGGHLDQGARACSAARRLLQVADGGDLRGPELAGRPTR